MHIDKKISYLKAENVINTRIHTGLKIRGAKLY